MSVVVLSGAMIETSGMVSIVFVPGRVERVEGSFVLGVVDSVDLVIGITSPVVVDSVDLVIGITSPVVGVCCAKAEK